MTVAKVARNVGWLALGELGIKGGVVVAVIIIGRELGPSAVGVFSVAYAAALVAVLGLALGQQEVLIREVARAPGSARRLLEISSGLQRGVGRFALPATCVAASLVPGHELRLALLAFVPYAFLRTATVTAGAAFKGLDRMDYESMARGLEVLVALVLIVLATAAGWPVWTAGVAFSIGSVSGLAWLLGRRKLLRDDGCEVSRSMMLREGLPFMALAVTAQLVNSSGRFLLVGFGVGLAEIGYLGAAGTVVWAMVTIPQLVAVAAYPTISRMAEVRSSPRSVGLSAAAVGIGGGLVAAMVLRLLGAPLMTVAFGPEFLAGVPLLERLSLALPGAFAAMTTGSVFAAWRMQRRTMVLYLVALTIGVAVNVAMIPAEGAMAAATAAAVAYSSLAVMLVALLFVRPPAGGQPSL
jgi:O-antigen/teichoic acid export membrane protein